MSGSDAFEGLTSVEAARRLAADGPNALPAASPRSLLQQFRTVVMQPMLLLLVGAGLINFLVAEVLDAIVLGSFVVVVVAISVVQEHRAERALFALRELSSPRALVIRDGVQVRIPGAEVVRGDVIVVSEGDRIPADAVLLTSLHCAVDESLLTGESAATEKCAAEAPFAHVRMGEPGGGSSPWIFSGSLLVRGQGLAVVLATGSDTAIGRIGQALQGIEVPPTRLQSEVQRAVRVIAVLGLIAATLVIVLYGVTRGDIASAFLAGIAAAMALLPEEFPVVLTLFLAMGAWRMSHHHVLTRSTPAIEALGAVTVLCVDKTGTLTQNRMTIQALMYDGASWEPGSGQMPDPFRDLVDAGLLASPVSPFDPMDRAFHVLHREQCGDCARRFQGWSLERTYPLSEQVMALGHGWRSPDGAELIVSAKGAPEAIAMLCRFDDQQRAALHEQVSAATAHGQRVIAIAWRRFPAAMGLPDNVCDLGLHYLGLACLDDPVRPGVQTAVDECAAAGVRTIMITGDFPGTAMAIARTVGIATGRGCITGPELAGMSDAELADRVAGVSVFARMVPDQKLRLVRALQANGEIVGMTGDGVNDAPALRAADIGIAMGGRGTDVAREAAALVITDDDFTSIAEGVRLGRTIYANLRKAMTYIVAIHVPIFGMALIPVLSSDWPLVLMPMQIAVLELIIDPACSLVFEAEGADPEILRQPPRAQDAPMFDGRMLRSALLQGVSLLSTVLVLYALALHAGRDGDAVRALAFAALVLGNVLLIVSNRSRRLTILETLRVRRNAVLPWIIGGVVIGFVVLQFVAPVRDALHLGGLTVTDMVAVLVAGLIAISPVELMKVKRR